MKELIAFVIVVVAGMLTGLLLQVSADARAMALGVMFGIVAPWPAMFFVAWLRATESDSH